MVRKRLTHNSSEYRFIEDWAVKATIIVIVAFTVFVVLVLMSLQGAI